SLERVLPPDDALPFVTSHIKSAHSTPPISGSLILSHRPQPDRLALVVALDHLLGDRAVLGKEDISLLVHRSRKEVLLSGKDIDDPAPVLRRNDGQLLSVKADPDAAG